MALDRLAVLGAAESAVKRGVRVVLLDALGTLVALRPPARAFAGILAGEHGVEVSEEDAERAFRTEIAYYRAHHDEGRDARTLEDLRARCAAVLARELPRPVARALSPGALTAAMLRALRFEAFDDAHPALVGLRARGCALAVVSNWDVSLVDVLREIGLLGVLDAAVSSAAVGAPKPAPAIFQEALARVGAEPSQALHVGDSFAQDVLGARAAGVAGVLLSRDGAGGADAAAARDAGAPVISSLLALLA